MTQTRYVDTRGHCASPASFTEAVINGLAEGGGLYIPETLPHLGLDEIVALGALPYSQQAAFIYKAFGIDLSDAAIDECMDASYGANFDDPGICPITSLDEGTHMLELWHGPTSAFKDMALQCLPQFFHASAEKLKEEGKLDHDFLILVATSGDTGKAALEGFKDKAGVRIAVLYPEGGVSDIQYRQMATQEGGNVMVWGVRGNFDDCQTAAKAVFGDDDFAARLLGEAGVALSSANSINWGRLLPQVVYYVSSYASLVRQGKVFEGDPIDICVPTGNFGNILAAWYAKQIGTPIDMLYCASNENRVLTDFINTGTYDISEREFVLTPSPSMDILVSSNLERQLFELSGRDDASIRTWMEDLKEKKAFRVDQGTFAKLRADFAADSVGSDESLQVIKDVFEKHGYLIDPHTAVAYQVARNLRGDNPVLIAATAHWAKFGESVYRALHGIAPSESLPAHAASLDGCALNELIAQETELPHIPQNLAKLGETKVRFKAIIDKAPDSVEKAILEFLT